MPEISHRYGEPALVCGADGPPLRGEHDALDLIGEALQHGVRLVVVPAHRLDDDFYVLRTGIAGQIIKKFVTYRLRLAVVGDISRHLAASSALRDLVYESNRGRDVWFLADPADLDRRLNPPAP